MKIDVVVTDTGVSLKSETGNVSVITYGIVFNLIDIVSELGLNYHHSYDVMDKFKETSGFILVSMLHDDYYALIKPDTLDRQTLVLKVQDSSNIKHFIGRGGGNIREILRTISYSNKHSIHRISFQELPYLAPSDLLAVLYTVPTDTEVLINKKGNSFEFIYKNNFIYEDGKDPVDFRELAGDEMAEFLNSVIDYALYNPKSLV